jgi:hypothetical protein
MQHRQADIEKVAGIIYESGLSPNTALAVNSMSGWSFDICYSDQEYIGNDFTRVEGLDLSPGDLTEALRVAAAWTAGDFEEKAR